MRIPYYQDAFATIYHGDCREILAELEAPDLVLTDPPYGIKESGKKNATRGSLARARLYLDDAWDGEPIEQALFDRLITFGREAIIWGGNYYQTPRASCWLVWDKCHVPGVDFADCELAFTTLRGAVRQFNFLWSGFYQQPGIPKQYRQHLTEKPIPLLRWCLGLARGAQTVLDPFMGGGTTLRACKDLGLKGIGIEIDERYCEISARRMAQGALSFEPQEAATQPALI